jgi:hypothetical protein
MRQQVEALLEDYHEAEIGRLLGIPDKDAKLMVRDIRSHITDWRPERSRRCMGYFQRELFC